MTAICNAAASVDYAGPVLGLDGLCYANARLSQARLSLGTGLDELHLNRKYLPPDPLCHLWHYGVSEGSKSACALFKQPHLPKAISFCV